MIKLDKLLKLAADMICTIDAQGRFVEVSEASLALLGYAPSELQGRSIQTLSWLKTWGRQCWHSVKY